MKMTKNKFFFQNKIFTNYKRLKPKESRKIQRE